MTSPSRRHLLALTFVLACAPSPALAQHDKSPEGLIKHLSDDVIGAVKSDVSIQGNPAKVVQLVDSKVMPHVNAERMTSLAVGRYWRQATPIQQRTLQEQFKLLLVRTYAGALTQVRNQTVRIKPMRMNAAETEVIVRTEVRGGGEPIQLDYRLEKSTDGWKIYDVNVLGVWLADNYRNSFAQEVSSSGIDGLIAKLAERNKAAAK